MSDLNSVLLEGIVTLFPPQLRDETQVFQIRSEHVQENADQIEAEKLLIFVKCRGSLVQHLAGISSGDRLRVVGRLCQSGPFDNMQRRERSIFIQAEHIEISSRQRSR